MPITPKVIYFTDRNKFMRPHLYSAVVAHELKEMYAIEDADKLVGTYPYPDNFVPKWAVYKTLEDAANAFKNAQDVEIANSQKKLDLMASDRNNLETLLTNHKDS